MSKSRRRQSGGSLVGGAIGLVVLLGLVSPNRDGVIEALVVLLGGLLLLGITAACVWVAWRLWRRLRTPKARRLSERFPSREYISGLRNRDGFWYWLREFWDAFKGHVGIVPLTSGFEISASDSQSAADHTDPSLVALAEPYC